MFAATTRVAAPAAAVQSQRRSVRAAASGVPRRDVMLAGGALMGLMASPAMAEGEIATRKVGEISVDSLSGFQRSAQRDAMLARINTYLKEGLTYEDASTCLRLVLNDAATFDLPSKTGGMDGSVVFELDRPCNKGLDATVAKLKGIKAKIDEESTKVGQGEVSWADLLVCAGRIATLALWRKQKVDKAQIPSGGETIATAFGADWPVRLGRVDATEAGPNVAVPQPGDDVETIKEFFFKLNYKNAGEPISRFGPKPPFWYKPTLLLLGAASTDMNAEEERLVAADEAFKNGKVGYDRSRRTVTRTDYEVDFVTFYTNLTNLGAKFDNKKYLVPVSVDLPKKL
ncbi:unnamed protein product [Pedinophyceae sp. YPF-701]|nr:unnamed protein product [Pedinophyceae sp. YPF-701]